VLLEGVCFKVVDEFVGGDFFYEVKDFFCVGGIFDLFVCREECKVFVGFSGLLVCEGFGFL